MRPVADLLGEPELGRASSGETDDVSVQVWIVGVAGGGGRIGQRTTGAQHLDGVARAKDHLQFARAVAECGDAAAVELTFAEAE